MCAESDFLRLVKRIVLLLLQKMQTNVQVEQWHVLIAGVVVDDDLTTMPVWQQQRQLRQRRRLWCYS